MLYCQVGLILNKHNLMFIIDRNISRKDKISGIFVFGIILAVSFSLTVRMKRQQADQLSRKDSRLQRIIETIANLKIIKLQVMVIF